MNNNINDNNNNNNINNRRLDNDITSDIQTRVASFIKRRHKDGFIDYKTKQFLIQTDPKLGRFYILAKIHKHGYPGRPIASCNGHPTEHISPFFYTLTLKLWSTKQHLSSKTLHISSTSLTNLDAYLVTLSLSH